MLEAIATLAIEGIDYSHTEQALHDIQQETNHLWAFAQEVGLDYRLGGRVYINDLWEVLQAWYVHNGTLEVTKADNGKEKRVWHDQPRRGDKNVKAPNQVHQRFAELFPKIQKVRDTTHRGPRSGQFYLSGIALQPAEAMPFPLNHAEASAEAVSLTQSRAEAAEAIFYISGSNVQTIIDAIARLSPQDKDLIKSTLLVEDKKNSSAAEGT